MASAVIAPINFNRNWKKSMEIDWCSLNGIVFGMWIWSRMILILTWSTSKRHFWRENRAEIWVFPWDFVCPSDPSTAVQYSMDGSTVYTKIMITKSLAIDVTPKQNVLLSLNCITMKKINFRCAIQTSLEAKKLNSHT